MNEIRLFGLMVERLLAMVMSRNMASGGSEKPPHDQAPVF